MVLIYLLRHEQRGEDVSFTSPLTREGMITAQTTLLQQLKSQKIDAIYSSPFIRCLQTIQPYCQASGKKVNIEWDLAEAIPYNADDPRMIQNFTAIINSKYRSKGGTLPKNTRFTFDEMKVRTEALLDYLYAKYTAKDTVLLVAHMPVINAIFNNVGYPATTMYTPYPIGGLSSFELTRR